MAAMMSIGYKPRTSKKIPNGTRMRSNMNKKADSHSGTKSNRRILKSKGNTRIHLPSNDKRKERLYVMLLLYIRWKMFYSKNAFKKRRKWSGTSMGQLTIFFDNDGVVQRSPSPYNHHHIQQSPPADPIEGNSSLLTPLVLDEVAENDEVKLTSTSPPCKVNTTDLVHRSPSPYNHHHIQESPPADPIEGNSCLLTPLELDEVAENDEVKLTSTSPPCKVNTTDSLSADLVIPTVNAEDLPRYDGKLEQSNGAMPGEEGKPPKLSLKTYYFKPLDLNEKSCTDSVKQFLFLLEESYITI
ncbi:Uncharacterized protein APZ42_008646 [Daphnia magna]|uniref:Uncharacterized protein n=1 Tax=Daphnia magna TaxID=35525 RepID=A0A164EI81_9CRUS|nr:Uncharacterized protein APZ42_008646 [Daphnia magna]